MNMGEVLQQSILDGFIFVLNIPIPIWKFTVPFWGVLLGMFAIGCMSISSKRRKRAFR